MKKLLILPLCALFLFGFATPVAFTGCSQLPTVGAPSQSVVVDAEKTLRISKDTFDIFLQLEKQNQVLVKSKFPQVHTFAEYIRKNAPTWLIQANQLKNDYKHGNGNLQALLAILSILKQNTTQAQTDITTINQH